MAYEKQIWEDRQVQNPLTYRLTNNPDGTITLTPVPGVVTNEGSIMSAVRLNHMEDGIAQINNFQFSFITSQVLTPTANSGILTGTTIVDYPDGFSQDNCIVIGLMANVPSRDKHWQTPRENSTSAYLNGSSDLYVTLLEDNILIGISKPDDRASTITVDVKVALMKIFNN